MLYFSPPFHKQTSCRSCLFSLPPFHHLQPFSPPPPPTHHTVVATTTSLRPQAITKAPSDLFAAECSKPISVAQTSLHHGILCLSCFHFLASMVHPLHHLRFFLHFSEPSFFTLFFKKNKNRLLMCTSHGRNLNQMQLKMATQNSSFCSFSTKGN